MSTIYTDRLSLPTMNAHVIELLLADDRVAAGAALGCTIGDDVDVEVASMPLERRLAQLRDDPTLEPWLLRAIVERATNALVGHVNFHTRPAPPELATIAPDGVELGYTIAPAHRRRGYAREAALAMMRWAFETHGQRTFVLTISPTNAPSLALAASLGFAATGDSHVDEEDGLELYFAMRIDDVTD